METLRRVLASFGQHSRWTQCRANRVRTIVIIVRLRDCSGGTEGLGDSRVRLRVWGNRGSVLRDWLGVVLAASFVAKFEQSRLQTKARSVVILGKLVKRKDTLLRRDCALIL